MALVWFPWREASLYAMLFINSPVYLLVNFLFSVPYSPRRLRKVSVVNSTVPIHLSGKVSILIQFPNFSWEETEAESYQNYSGNTLHQWGLKSQKHWLTFSIKDQRVNCLCCVYSLHTVCCIFSLVYFTIL